MKTIAKLHCKTRYAPCKIHCIQPLLKSSVSIAVNRGKNYLSFPLRTHAPNEPPKWINPRHYVERDRANKINDRFRYLRKRALPQILLLFTICNYIHATDSLRPHRMASASLTALPLYARFPASTHRRQFPNIVGGSLEAGQRGNAPEGTGLSSRKSIRAQRKRQLAIKGRASFAVHYMAARPISHNCATMLHARRSLYSRGPGSLGELNV